METIWGELRRRKVVRVAIAYAIGAWVLLQIGDTVFGLLELPGWVGKVLVGLLVIGLPIALILSWMYDWTPKGVVVTGDQEAPATQAFEFSEPEPIDVSELELTRPQLGKLIGRRDECETIRQCLADAQTGTGGILLIGGEPGVGKSRLGEEALAIGRDMGLLPLTGHAYEDRGAPFITSSEILEEAILVLPADTLRNVLGTTAPEIAKLLPELRHVFPDIPEATELPPDQQQRFLFKSVLEFLKRLGRCTPVVMMLDDLHWADESSILLLEHLAPHARQLPILMVATFRDVESDMGEPFKRALAALSREPYITRVALHRFSRNDVSSLLKVLSNHEPPDNVVDAIFEETNGNAFFVKSVYEHLADENRLFDEQGQWLTDIDPAWLDVPDSVRLVTGRRIARLSQNTQDMLIVAAVMGLRFRLPLLEAACGDPDSVIEAVEEAEAAHLLKRSRGGRELRYEFVHALARQTVLSSLSAPRQQKLHLKIAEVIEKVRARNLEPHAADLALHLVEAGSYAAEDNTVHWLTIAGKNAMATAALEEAMHYFDTALSIVNDAEQELRAELLNLRGPARLSLGDNVGFQADLHEAFSIYEANQLGEKAAQVAYELAYILVFSAQPDEAHALVSRALKLTCEERSPGRCRLLSARGAAHSMGNEPGDPSASKRSHDAAVTMARQLGDPRLLAETLQGQAIGNWHRLEAAARKPAHEAASILRESNRGWNLGQCLWMEKTGLVGDGLFEEAARIDEELRPLTERIGDFGSLAIMELMSAPIHQASGDLAASSQAMRRSTESFEAGGFPWGIFNDGYLSVNLVLQGKNEDARRALDVVSADFQEGTNWTGCQVGYWLSGKANLGDSDILEQYRKYQTYVPQPGEAMTAGTVVFLKGSIEALILAGEKDEAAKLYPLIAEFVDSKLGLFEFTFGLHERFAGMAAAAAEDWDNAVRHFEHSLKLADELPHRVDQARVRYWYARMLLDRAQSGDKDRALALLAETRCLSEEMGMHGLVTRIDDLSAAA